MVVKLKILYSHFFAIIGVLILFYLTQIMLIMNQSDNVSTFNYVISIIVLLASTIVYVFINGGKFISISNPISKLFKFWLIYVILNNVVTNVVVVRNYTESLIIIIPFISFFVSQIMFREYDFMDFYKYMVMFSLMVLTWLYYNEYNMSNLYFTDNTRASLNIAYIPFLFLPSVLLFKKKVLKITFIVVISIIMISSMKRAGLLALITSLGVYYIAEYLKNSQKQNKVFGVIIIASLIGVIVFGIFTYNKKTDNFLITRIEQINEDEGSGRKDVYQEVVELITHSNGFNLIFGHGENAVMRTTKDKLSSHSDFLEIIYNYGVIIFLVYLMIHYQLIAYIRKLFRERSEYATAFLVSYIQFLILSTISHIIVYPYFIILTFFWGMILGVTERSKKEINE